MVPTSNRSKTPFSELKALLRKAAKRTVDGPWDRIGAVLQEFTPQECKNFFADT
jgi:hypothetical protein